MARKYPSELNTRTIRINIGSYQMLKKLSQQLDMTMAEAFDQVITDQVKQKRSRISPTQISMPVIIARRSTMPVTLAKSMPASLAESKAVTTARQRSMPVVVSFSREMENGNRHRQINGRRA